MGKDLRGKEIGANIKQRKDGLYEGRYTDRFKKRRSIYDSSLSRIKQRIKEKKLEELKQITVKKDLTLSEWYETWMNIFKIPVIKSTSAIIYAQHCQKFILPHMGSLHLQDIRTHHCQEIINCLQENNYSISTQKKTKILMENMFSTAMENDYMLSNPARKVRINTKRRGEKFERIVLTKEQQKDFFRAAAGTFYYNLFVVAINTGMRIGELAGLTKEEIDFEKKRICVRRTLTYHEKDVNGEKVFSMSSPKTRTSTREIPLTNAAIAALQDQLRLREVVRRKKPEGDKQFPETIFRTSCNGPICSQNVLGAIQQILRDMNKQRDDTEKIPYFSCHSFRHTYATRCVEAGIEPKVLQKHLGHATLDMTMNLYVHVTDEFEEIENRKLEKIFSETDENDKIISFSDVKLG